MSFNRKEWKLVESGIYKHTERPKTYYVIARLPYSTAIKKATVSGTLADAKAKYADLVLALKNRSLKDPKKYTHLWKALGFYIHRHYSRSKQYRIGSGKAIMRYWIGRIGEINPAELKPYHINQAIRELEENGYAQSGIVPYVSRLRTALEYARSEGKITFDRDLWNEILKLRPKTPKKIIFDRSVLEPFYKSLPDYAIRVIRYKSMVPCRLIELFEAKADTIDLENRTFKIHRDKNGNERTLPIPAVLLPEFEKVLADGSEYVFYRTETTKNGTFHYPLSRNHLSVLWSKTAKAEGIDSKIKLRMLRHLAISEWRQNGIGDNIIEDVAGATRETMRTYYDMVPVSALVSAADKIATITGTGREPYGKIVPFVRSVENASC